MKRDLINGITICCLILPLFSCSIHSNDAQAKLTGTWVLDSVSSPKGGFYKSDLARGTITFKARGRYSFKSWNGDAISQNKGLYYLHTNPNRKITTIVFIADLEMSGKDTIRIYKNFDIVFLSETTLKLVGETEFIKRDSLHYQAFNKEYIYKLRR
ncbi:hypothetical protein KXD93_08670 [Mucilaginibacter sp. BJC16-A38]|uniref:hypothetical protein n=1 Tax=Mucilaginibacter phenanthrenivorans TaxID=1234842 RepID=UPI002156FD20|nr:hypothetical protein [Mucilaginibacter phenanthrenivorans]MCR8557712.1 hypothetical protein [Mucilaginibacter phenanthrenivorans]